MRTIMSAIGIGLVLGAGLPAATGAERQGVQAHLYVEKSELAVGEPLVVKLIVANKTAEQFRFRGLRSVSLGKDYWIKYRETDGQQRWRPVDLGAQLYLLGMRDDPYALWPAIAPGREAAAVHLLLGPDAQGAFSLKGVFGQPSAAVPRSPDQDLPETPEVQLTVGPMPEGDPAAALAESGQLKRLCLWITAAQYSSPGAGPPPEGPAGDLAERLRQAPKDSILGEYVLYAFATTRESHEPSTGGLATEESAAQEAAARFLSEYPDSFLRADVYRRLSQLYYESKDYRAAIRAAEAGNALEESSPLYRNDGTFLVRVAQAYHALGEEDAARRWAERVKAAYPDPTWWVHDKAQAIIDDIEGRPHAKQQAAPRRVPAASAAREGVIQ